MTQVFISYSRKDKLFAGKFTEASCQAGDMPPTQYFEVREALHPELFLQLK